MRIVQAIETSGPGGAETVLLRLCVRLKARGHDTRALLLRGGWLQESLEREGIEVTVLPIARALDLSFLRRLTAFLEEQATEIFHSHEITFALYGRAATARLALPHVATAHGGNFSRGFKRKGLGVVALRQASRFRLVAVSAALAEGLSRDFVLAPEAIEVIPNGIEMPPPREPVARRDGEPLAIVSVGNLYPVKNQALLVRAVAGLRARGVVAELDILGRGQEHEALARLSAELGVAEQVRLRGFRADVPEFLARAHVFASSSVSEAMPLSFLEAMAAGLPVVASRVGGVPEIVEHGANGLLFRSGSVAEAVLCLERLASDEALRLRLAARAAESVRGRYDLEGMIGRYLDLYRTVAAS